MKPCHKYWLFLLFWYSSAKGHNLLIYFTCFSFSLTSLDFTGNQVSELSKKEKRKNPENSIYNNRLKYLKQVDYRLTWGARNRTKMSAQRASYCHVHMQIDVLKKNVKCKLLYITMNFKKAIGSMGWNKKDVQSKRYEGVTYSEEDNQPSVISELN